MLKFWMRLYRDGKLQRDAVCDADEKLPPARVLEDGLKACCYELDIPNPVVLKKHVSDIRQYHLTRFLPDDFLESVSFDRAEVTLFDDSKNKKRMM
ncbi:MAG: hypothetical protein J6X30_02730 [Clostridia bacterium]|nr:hypothetical protein [Clostridia bacterium]